MGIVHNSYCYEIGSQAVDAFNSESGRFFGVDSGFGEMHAHSDFGIYMHYYPVTGNGPPHTFTGHYLPTCSTPGPLGQVTNRDTISNLSDAYTVAWLIVAVFAGAWAIKTLKQAI